MFLNDSKLAASAPLLYSLLACTRPSSACMSICPNASGVFVGVSEVVGVGEAQAFLHAGACSFVYASECL